MHSLIRASLLSATAFVCSGCAAWNTLESQARVDPRTVAGYEAHQESRGPTAASPHGCDVRRLRGDAYDVPINLDCFKFPEQEGKGDIAYVKAASAKADRNRLASILMKHSDDICTKEMGDLSAREAISNTALGVATSLLSGLGAVVTGEHAKAWLAGGAGLTNATRDHINAEVFRNVLASALAKAIDNDRAVRRKLITDDFTDEPTTYSVDQMIADVNRYHHSCSFYNGLVLVVDAVNRASPTIAAEYRDKSAGIADLSMAIADYDRRIAATSDATEKQRLSKERDELITQRGKLYVERSKLGVAAPKDKPATAPNP